VEIDFLDQYLKRDRLSVPSLQGVSVRLRAAALCLADDVEEPRRTEETA
jgi:hypothetical protein